MGQEGFDLGGGGGVAVEEVGPLGQQGAAGAGFGAGWDDGEFGGWVDGVHRRLFDRSRAGNIKRIMYHSGAQGTNVEGAVAQGG